VLRATGAETASLLENLSNKAESCGDRHGTAICMMHRADSLVSVPVAHIVSLNLVLVEGTGAGLFNSRWDTQEPSARLRRAMQQRIDQADAARELYREALAIVDDISASRLSAAIHLRLGCLGHLEAFLSDNSDLISAANELKMAHELFSAGGDETGCRLVDAHFILVAVIQRDRQHLDQRVQDIIRWYQTSGYRPFMHYLGLLISRFGYSRQQSYDTAALCYDAALKLFEASNHPLSAFQVEVQQGKLLRLANDTVASMESLARAEATLERLIETWGANVKLNQQPWYHHMISVLKSDLRDGIRALEHLDD
jgi:tetratricopeptide (TPR) repeat protein